MNFLFGRGKVEELPYNIRVSKGSFSKLRGQIAQNVPEAVWLRHMDFLKYSDEVMMTDETALYSPSGLITGFSGRPCPEISGY